MTKVNETLVYLENMRNVFSYNILKVLDLGICLNHNDPRSPLLHEIINYINLLIDVLIFKQKFSLWLVLPNIRVQFLMKKRLLFTCQDTNQA